MVRSVWSVISSAATSYSDASSVSATSSSGVMTFARSPAWKRPRQHQLGHESRGGSFPNRIDGTQVYLPHSTYSASENMGPKNRGPKTRSPMKIELSHYRKDAGYMCRLRSPSSEESASAALLFGPLP